MKKFIYTRPTISKTTKNENVHLYATYYLIFDKTENKFEIKKLIDSYTRPTIWKLRENQKSASIRERLIDIGQERKGKSIRDLLLEIRQKWKWKWNIVFIPIRDLLIESRKRMKKFNYTRPTISKTTKNEKVHLYATYYLI